MRTKILPMILLIACIVTPTAWAQQEVLVNGSFETGSLYPWETGGTGLWSVVPGGPAGSYCAYTYWSTWTWLEQAFNPILTNDIDSVTLWGKGYYSSADQVPLSVTYYYLGGSTSTITITVPQNWARFNITNGLSPNAILYKIRIVGEGDPYNEPKHWVDGVSIIGTPSTPNLSVNCEPVNPPIVIPPIGGFFDFNVTLINNDSIPATFDVWTMVYAPNGFWVGPIFYVYDITMPPLASITRTRTQYIPTFAPAGTYIYKCCAGDYPNQIWASDSFSFIKQQGENNSTSRSYQETGIGWDNFGEGFEQ